VVSIDRPYDYTPGTPVKPGQRYKNWTKTNTLDSVQFQVLHSKNELKEVLRRAQLAVLNPSRDALEYLTGARAVAVAGKSQVGFSPNVVSLSISGPELAELSFFDLPGAINVPEDEDEAHLVELIEVLTKSYIEDENCRVLLALVCNQDTENSTAFRYVRECGASERCMGVLTKPDLLSVERTSTVGRMLSNEIFRLGYGWFASKQLSQADLDSGVASSEPAVREMDFFSTQPPWTTDLSGFGDRFGIGKLQDAISERLTQHICECLPVIKSRVDDGLVRNQHALSALPEDVKHPSISVMTEVDALVKLVCLELHSDGTDNSFRKSYRATIRKLQEVLCKVRPVIAMGTPGVMKKMMPISLDSDDNQDESEESPSKHRKTANGTPMKIKKEPNGRPPAAVVDRPKTFSLGELKELCERGSSNSLPGQSNPKLTEKIIQQSRQCWESIVVKAVQEIRRLFDTMLSEIVHRSLATRSRTALFSETNQLAHTLFDSLMEQQQLAISVMLQNEMHKPVTFANESLLDRKAAVEAKLSKDRLQARVNEYFDWLDARNSKTTTPEDRKKKATDAWIESTLKKDPYEIELKAMVLPLAYYDTSALHLVDTIAKSSEYGLFHKLADGLKQYLLIGLNFESAERCAQLLEDDPERRRLRVQLLAVRSKLQQASHELDGLSVPA